MATTSTPTQGSRTYLIRLIVYRRVPVEPDWIMLHGWISAMIAEGLVPDDREAIEVSVTQRREGNQYKARTEVEIYEVGD